MSPWPLVVRLDPPDIRAEMLYLLRELGRRGLDGTDVPDDYDIHSLAIRLLRKADEAQQRRLIRPSTWHNVKALSKLLLVQRTQQAHKQAA